MIKKLGTNLIRKDPFGRPIILKRILIMTLGIISFSRLNVVNKLKVEGMEHLKKLPKNNVLIISNHQTYYIDVIAVFHVISAVKWHFRNFIKFPIYLLNPYNRLYFVAAEETMLQSGILPKILAITGAITVKRHWRSKGKNINRAADKSAPLKIKKSLESGWVVNFPQGTTRPYSPVRKGTAHIIQEFKPIVIPIVIDGFRRAFDKKGFFYKKRGSLLRMKIKPPIIFKEKDSLDYITQIVREAIEQNPEQSKNHQSS